MKNFWVVSDTHFNHANILNFKNKDGNSVRPFSSVEEMNETMIDRWNEVVKPGDHVYHLGDVVFGENKQDWMGVNWPRLSGKKRLIVGNHDNIKMLSSGGWFGKVVMWYMFENLLFTHVPVHPSTLAEKRFLDWNRKEKQMINVHGHIHQNMSPEGPYKCVCVEQINYRPINIDELL